MISIIGNLFALVVWVTILILATKDKNSFKKNMFYVAVGFLMFYIIIDKG